MASYRSLTTYYPESTYAQYIAGNGYAFPDAGTARSAALASTLGGYDASRYFGDAPGADDKVRSAAAAAAAAADGVTAAEFKYKPPPADFSTSSTSVTPSQTPHSHPGSGNTFTTSITSYNFTKLFFSLPDLTFTFKLPTCCPERASPSQEEGRLHFSFLCFGFLWREFSNCLFVSSLRFQSSRNLA